jgi:hypothetical protein
MTTDISYYFKFLAGSQSDLEKEKEVIKLPSFFDEVPVNIDIKSREAIEVPGIYKVCFFLNIYFLGFFSPEQQK